VRYFDWNDTMPPPEPIEEPTPEQPLVYHLYGRLDRPESMVLTEDDYFQWLAAWANERQEKLPKPLYASMFRRSLAFVGYRLHDWDFRVLFQGLRNFSGKEALKRQTHVGVQVDPSAPGVEPESAQDYVDSYFSKGGVTIFWGSTKEFLNALAKHTAEAA
jgi:hypothetical protein